MTSSARDSEPRWTALRREVGLKLSTRLFDELSAGSTSTAAQQRSVSLFLAYVAASCVYGASVAFGAIGIGILIRPWQTLFDPIVSAILFLLCWAARPRLGEPPYYVLSRSDFPRLYELSDRTAVALQAPRVEAIAYSADFGANFRQAGWAGKAYVELGAPLMAILQPSERLAVLAHELSHGANGDPLRSMYLQGAVNTLASWGTSARPPGIGTLGDGMPFGPIISLLGIPINLLMLAVSEALLAAARGLLLLVMRQSQRAEYKADLLAASVAGSKEMMTALEKTYLGDSVLELVRRHALLTPYEPIKLRLWQEAGRTDAELIERLRASSLEQQWQVDATHPPTALRVRLLESFPSNPLPELLELSKSDALEAEIQKIVALAGRELINRQLEAASS